MNDFEIYTVSSLQKVMPGERPELFENENTCFRNETFSFQVAFRNAQTQLLLQNCTWKTDSGINGHIRVRPVAHALCSTACHNGHDDYYLTESAALMPDILTEESSVSVRCADWQSLWVTVSGDLPAGTHVIGITLYDGNGGVLGSTEYTLRVIDKLLPECDLKYAHWFHYDSVAAYYGEKVFSPAFDKIMWRYVRNAADHGVNVLLVPLFTPPLNTAGNCERLTAQLVDIEENGGEYKFDFARLCKFMRTAKTCGIKYFEMSHLYTQWGAACAPKIVAKSGGKEKRIFGWEDRALGDRYVKFIKAFLPALTAFLHAEGYGDDECLFHISDEPSGDNLLHYFEIRKLIKPLIGNYKIFDALSCYDFYKEGVVDIPVVSTDHAHTFTENGVTDWWAYYCCGQGSNWLSNRFMSMPLQRTRIIGFQMYTAGCKGFLHWGYNYYNTGLSEKYIDPYAVTDAGGSFQSGDSFIVYPARNGAPLDSIRHEVMFDAFQDYRACKLLEKLRGREFTLAFLKSNGIYPNFTDYPKNALWHINFRKKLNALIEE